MQQFNARYSGPYQLLMTVCNDDISKVAAIRALPAIEVLQAAQYIIDKSKL